jgi:hypothetical protein
MADLPTPELVENRRRSIAMVAPCGSVRGCAVAGRHSVWALRVAQAADRQFCAADHRTQLHVERLIRD